MNKELETALHYLTNRTICKTKQVSFNYDAYIKNIQIVVKALKLYALKDYEKQHLVDIDLLGTAYKTNIQNQKQLQALEIIKEKEVDVHNFKEFLIKQEWTYEQYLDEESDPNTSGHQFAYKLLTQEEYNILREVLL